MRSTVAVLFASAAVQALPATTDTESTWVVGQPVKTTSGEVTGHEASWPAGSGVSEYLGIPYGVPPVGDLRFEKPQRYKGSGPINGEKFGKECVQFIRDLVPYLNVEPPEIKGFDKDLINFGKALAGGPNVTFDEDCLNLNVWAKPQTGDKKKAVLVWIYGGAFSVGASSAPYYSPARYAAEQDVVAVSFNYRLSVLGFPMTPLLKEQNLGLLDQRLALEWVRDNIEAFGGDPKRITIFGESAGASSVDYYSYAYKDDPIVAGLISQSGTAAGLIGDTPTSKQWWIVSKGAGCGDEADGFEKSLACMKKVSVDKLMTGVGKVGFGGAASTILSFWPVADNKTVFADILNRQKAKLFMKKPMLIGSNDNEAGLLTGIGVAVGSVLKANQDTIPEGAKSLAKGVLQGLEYMNSTGTLPNIIRQFLHFIEDGVFDCPASTAANARQEANVPVWRYRMYHTFENALIAGVGAYHLADVPIVMGTTERKVGGKKNTEEEDKLIKNVMTAWSTFAKDPEEGLTKMGWPKYDSKKNTLIRLGYQNKGTPDFTSPAKHDMNCAKYVIPPSAPKVMTKLVELVEGL